MFSGCRELSWPEWALKFLLRVLVGSSGLRVQLEGYLGGETPRVYSLVASVPFSPVDIDLNLLARGEWDASKDRMRIWFLPATEGQGDKTSGYVMIRKFDQQQGVLVCLHVVMNMEAGAPKSSRPYFTIGILSNDDARARAVLGIFLGVPPIFHERSEIALVEGRWRDDPATVMRFVANVHSTIGSQGPGPVYRLKFEPPADLLASLKPGLDNWWDSPREDEDEGSSFEGTSDEADEEDTTRHKS
jgi:hypothetical protein